MHYETSGTGYPPFSVPSSSSPSNWNVAAPAVTNIFNEYLYGRDMYHWDKATYAVPANRTNHLAAVIYHFQHVSTDASVQAAGVLEAIFNPLDDAIWYAHPGESSTGFTGTLDQPSEIGRTLPGSPSTTQLWQYAYNSFGNITKRIDPVGYETDYTYASNNIDLDEVQQKRPSSYDTLFTATWNSQHEPLTVTAATGYTTTYTYNAAGQILTKTDPYSDVTTYAYADRSGTGSGNFLHTITDANGQVVATYTYDAVGRVATYTDSQGYTLSYSYDNLDRLTKIAYPDGTTTTYTYNKLDLVQVKDRLNRITTYTYDADRNLTSVIDPLGRTVTYGYDPDGRLTSVTDPEGHKTTWTRDLEGRVTKKTFQDGTSTNYSYDIAGRLLTRTDALSQVTTYGYAADNLLTSKTYTNTVNPTPNVTYTWTGSYPRLRSVTDGSGPNGASETTTFNYWGVGGDGALRIATESSTISPIANYLNAYDHLDRLDGRFIGNPFVLSDSLTYDPIGRIVADGTIIGNFFYNYVGETNQLSSWGLNGTSGPVSTLYTYASNAADRRLSGIFFPTTTNSEDLYNDPGAASGYVAGGGGRQNTRELTTNASGSQQIDQYTYDSADRTTGDNITYLQDGLATGTSSELYSYDSDDFLLGYADKSLSWTATPSSSGMNQIASITFTPGGTKTYTYDADGEVLSDGTNNYTWDAEHRLLSIINISTGHVTSFRYDGLNRRVAIDETLGNTTTETDYLWCGAQLCAAYDTSGNLIARYAPQGEAEYSGSAQTNLYYQRDYLGSVVGVTDSNGNSLGQLVTNAYGRTLSQTGTVPTFGFAGMFLHQPSGLYLTLNRAYDPTTGRWLSRDPAGELANPGFNLYSYVQGNPINNVDPLGLGAWPWGTAPADQPYPPTFNSGPSGPWTWSPNPQNSRGGQWMGPQPPEGGQRPMCTYAPPGPNNPDPYWKSYTPPPPGSPPGTPPTIQRYDSNGNPITPDEAHPGPSASSPEPVPTAPEAPDTAVPEVPEVAPIIEIP